MTWTVNDWAIVKNVAEAPKLVATRFIVDTPAT